MAYKKRTYTKPEPVARRCFTPAFPASPEQEPILDRWIQGDENMGIDAGPGSGKSTTLKWLMALAYKDIVMSSQSAAMLAFSKAIVTEIEPECAPNVAVSTAHSFGYKAMSKKFGRLFVNGGKQKKIFTDLWPHRDPSEVDDEERGAAYSFMFDFLKLIDMLKVNLRDETNSDDVMQTIMQYGIELDLTDELMSMLQAQFKASLGQTSFIDFVDMIWMPIRLGLQIPQFDVVYVDERQDLNSMMIEYLFRMTKERIVHVGDERQSIFSFAGADTHSTQRLIQKFGGQQLPLKVCYRCGTDIVAFAQQVYPDGILPFDKNPTGCVEEVQDIDYTMPDGSMILSRRNANLVRPCFKLLREGRKAIIKGKDIGAGLLKIVKSVKAANTIDLIDRVQLHQEKRVEKLLKQKGVTQAMIEKIEDECQCIIEIANGCGSTVKEVEDRIEKLFDENTNGITLSSCHRSKGLEADMVTIIDFDRIRLSHDKMSKEDHIQEKNLDFVARTRAKKVLHLVRGTTKAK